MKARKCKVCKCPITSPRPLQVVCGPACAIALAVGKREKAERAAKTVERQADAVKRESMKSMGKLIAEAQTSFNAYVRERDRLAGHTCISSGRTLDWTGNAVDAGHFRSRGSAPHLRFDERNCHAQSKQENRYASGNATGYRVGLIARIGLEAVEALECDQTPRKYTRDELKQIKADYTARARALKKD